MFRNVEILILVERLDEFRRKFGVGGGTVLQPLGECHEDLDDIDHVCLLVELLDDRRELGELVSQPRDKVGVFGGVDLRDEGVDGEQELVDQLRARDALGGPCLLPSLGVAPFGYGDARHVHLVGNLGLFHACEVERPRE